MRSRTFFIGIIGSIIGMLALILAVALIMEKQVTSGTISLVTGGIVLIGILVTLIARPRPSIVHTLPPILPAAPPAPVEAAPVVEAATIVAAPPIVALAPTIPAAPPAPAFLPGSGPLFVGREQELDALVAEIRRHHGTGAIAVVRPAGAGKHTVIMRAIEAHRAAGTFTDGYSWHPVTDLGGDRGLRKVLIDVLDRFGGPAVAMTTTLRMGEAAVADLVRGRRILFWLDDVPQDFPIGRAISTLTARDDAGIGPTLVLSSRADWDMPEITEIPLDPPQLDEALDLVREWMELAGRGVARDDYDAIKAICANLSNVPLALRLAAGYAAASRMKLTKLAADLGSVVYPPGDVTRTLTHTIAFVASTLFPQPRRGFAALAACEYPIIPLDAAAAVAAAVSGATVETATADLEAMMVLGLLEPDGDDATPQVRLHPFVRAHAAEVLQGFGPAAVAAAQDAWQSVTRLRHAAQTPAEDDDESFDFSSLVPRS